MLISRRMAMRILFIALCLPGTLLAAAEEVVTQASQISALVETPVRHIVKLHLQATVYATDRHGQALWLKDDSGFVRLEGVSAPQLLKPGTRVVIEGKGAFGQGQASLQSVPVVEQDWARGHQERAGCIQLAAGKHPFELSYFQGAGLKSLTVSRGGPGLALTNIPASALFCADPATGQLVPGVRFESYEGSWIQLPDLQGLKPERTGVTTNFSIGISGRETNFAIRFSGFIETPAEGVYQFTVTADDGARLFIKYDATHHVRVIGQEPLLVPRTISSGQAWGTDAGLFWAEVEGTVKHASRNAGRLQMELSSEKAGRMRVTVFDGDEAVPGLLLNSRISARGLCQSTLTPAGSRLAGELFVPGMAQITITRAAEVLWLLHPVNSVSNLVNLQPTNAPGHIAHVQGSVTEIEPGKSLLLEDPSGRIRVNTAQASAQDLGTAIEALGQLILKNGEPALAGATFRAASPGETLPTLTTIEQARRLKPQEAALHYPVKVRGVVTFVFDGGKRAHVQGESEGIYVSGLSTSRQGLQVGDLCEFDGFASAGAFSPVLTYRTATVLGRGHLPDPLRPSWSQLINGSLDSQWVEVQGVVMGARGQNLLIGIPGGQINARITGASAAELRDYLDAIVRVRGTVRPIANRQRQVQSVQLQVASLLQITVDHPAPADPFSAPSRLVSELREFDPGAASFQRVKTAGQVVHVRNGVGYLMDGTNGMRFMPREQLNVSPGDQVEVVGLPDIEGSSPALRQALVRKTGQGPLPLARALSPDDLFNSANDATRVSLEAAVVAVSTNQSDQVLELNIGARICKARLENSRGILPSTPVGSQVRLNGTYVGQGLTDASSGKVELFELLLDKPADLTVLRRPSWWTLGRALVAVGGMTLVLALALIWITALRHQVESRTSELKAEVESHKRTEAELKEKTKNLQDEIRERIQLHAELEDKKTRLENEIDERKRMELEVERIHRQLVDASRQAGQAEVASSVLHNVGNVLNSVNVSTGLITGRLRSLRTASVGKVADLLHHHHDDLGRFLTEDQRGRQLPKYLESLSKQLDEERTDLLKEVSDLTQNVEHIKEIVAMQQNYAKVAGLTETVPVSELLENAVRMHAGAFVRHGVGLVRQFEDVPPVTVDKHKVLQILVNLLHNAKYACDAGNPPEKRILLRIAHADGQRVKIEIADNGIGIAPENLGQLFRHGFTTRKNGHGFGLHSAAIAAKELGGTLTAHSEGLGHGATFTLEMPV